MKEFQSVFREQLSGYMKLRHGLGFSFQEQAYILHAFDRYVHQRIYTAPLTQKLALEFATNNPENSTNYQARRYQIVRHFSEYLRAFVPQTPPLDPKALPHSITRTPPYIYTDEELECILHEALNISPINPVRGVTLHAMVGLGASTGLRISEVVSLDRVDVDLETGVLLIKKTKFSKDRFVPVHSTTLQVLRNYAAMRDASFPDCNHVAFFINMMQRRFCRNTLQQAFRKLARRVGLRGPKGRGPSFHGLRHRFAVKRLVTWYKQGVDVQAMLPALATYMGHVHYSDTAYYLKATAELLGLAAERYHSSFQK
jgi:integrase